jgi:alpha-L-fucosidase 2
MSPNFTFYPGSSITLRGTPDLAAATLKRMETRNSRGGWPAAWDICMWARLERGEKVAAVVRNLLQNSLAPNLHNSGANQSDASFGFTAGVAEALVQSHAGELSLLPAIPAGWDEGSVSGLCARGGCQVSLQWKARQLKSAEIHSLNGGEIKIRCGQKTTNILTKPGETLHLNATLAATNR